VESLVILADPASFNIQSISNNTNNPINQQHSRKSSFHCLSRVPEDTMNSSRNSRKGLVLLGLSSLIVPNAAFMPIATKANVWQLGGVIRGEDLDSNLFDVGSGGVRLAQESAIKITGEVKHKPGQADARPMELLRYNTLQQVDESTVNALMEKTGSKVICTGNGAELYKNPGETLETTVKLAPMEAIKDAVAGSASAMESDSLVFNFLGGDDLMMGEVLDASNEMIVMMDIATKAKISFNSLCHDSIPAGTCTVTVVSLASSDSDYEASDGVEKAVASGELYLRDGSWWTVLDSEINTAVA
jgi:hypothetical protein